MRALRIARYCLFSAISSVRGSLALHLFTVVTVAVSFFILGGLLLAAVNVRNLVFGARQMTQMAVYLEDSSPSKTAGEIQARFCTRPIVKDCSYISAKAAREQFAGANPELKSILQSLETNPFPGSVQIFLDPAQRDRQRLQNFAKELETLPGVIWVDAGGEWLSRWFKILDLADGLMWAVGLVFAASAVFVISNTIKLMVYARRDEVEILSLVGATSRVIRTPFVLEGLFQGLMGGLVALVALRLFFLFSIRQFFPAAGLESAGPETLQFLSTPHAAALVAGAALIGVVGSAWAVGRFLKW
ncbi:MAG: permease-like cell division protein FtsX [Pseudomonadota bacterium]